MASGSGIMSGRMADRNVVAQICEQCQVQPEEIEDVYPCTPSQASFMAHPQLNTQTLVHSIDPSVDLDRLCDAIHHVVARHAIFRTRIVDVDGDDGGGSHGLLQVVMRKGEPVLRCLDSGLARFLEGDCSVPMQLGESLARFALVGDDEEQEQEQGEKEKRTTRRLVTTMQHALFDYHVQEMFMSDMWSFYRGAEKQVVPAPFKAFAEQCSAMDAEAAAAFWRNRFQSDAASPFPPVPPGYSPVTTDKAVHEIMLRATSGTGHKKNPLETGTAPLPKGLPSPALMPAYLEAAWALTMGDYTGSDSVTYGYVLSGRGGGGGGGVDTTRMCGPTAATVPVQADVKYSRDGSHDKTAMTIGQLLKARVSSRRALLASPFSQYGLRRIRNDVSEEARAATHFQTILNILYRSEGASLSTSGLALDEAHSDPPPKECGLVLWCSMGDQGEGASQGQQQQEIMVRALFDPVVLAPEQMRRVLRQLEHRLKQLISFPPSTPLSRLTSLNMSDMVELMTWNRRDEEEDEEEEGEDDHDDHDETAREGPAMCIDQLIALRSRQHPDDTAVDAWDGRASYAELVVMAENLARQIRLRSRDNHDTPLVGPEEPVCVVAGRSLSLAVASLAVMKLGGVVVPVDSSLPRARREAVVRLCRARLVLTSPQVEETRGGDDYTTHTIEMDRVPHSSSSSSSSSFSSRAAAYVLFTSGSTGQPKGAVLEHGSLVSSLTKLGGMLGWTRATRALQFSSPAWDACVFELLGPLLMGGCTCIPSDHDRESGLGEYIRSARVDFALMTPTALLGNLRPADVLPSSRSGPGSAPVFRTLVCAGESAPRDVYEMWGGQVDLWYGYGPCEASVMASMAHMTPADGGGDGSRLETMIGRPVGCSIWITDPDDVNRLLPIGALGEMLIDGPGVARGYHLQPQLTEAAFPPPPPFAVSPRVYRTGDLGRYNADGSLTFGGRRDSQVKIRGQRFELGEVETVLTSHPEVSEAVVVVVTGTRKELVALVTFAEDGAGDEEDVQGGDKDEARPPGRDELPLLLNETSRRRVDGIGLLTQSRLPSYMVPTLLLPLRGRLPQTVTKKIDRVRVNAWLSRLDLSAVRQAILQAGTRDGGGGQSLTPPTGPREVALQRAWAAVLRLDPSRIGCECSFVRLGGDSIAAMQVATRCRRLGFSITVAALLRQDSLAASADDMVAVAQKERHAPYDPSFLPPEESNRRFPLSPVQKLFADDGGPASGHHFNQAFLLDLQPSTSSSEAAAVSSCPTRLRQALGRLVKHHSMLRSRFSHVGEDTTTTTTLVQRTAPYEGGEEGEEGSWRFRVHELHHGADDADALSIMRASQASLDTDRGPVFAADVFVSHGGDVSLFLVAHHLAIDLVSWRILWEDLHGILCHGDSYSLVPTMPFPLWVQHQRDTLSQARVGLAGAATTPWPRADRQFWGVQDVAPRNRDLLRIRQALDPEQTARIMGPACNARFNTTPVVLLTTALLMSFLRVFPDRGGVPAMYGEGHGRPEAAPTDGGGPDVSRTVGWFTVLFPLLPPGTMTADTPLDEAVVMVKDWYHGATVDGRSVSSFASHVLDDDDDDDRPSSTLARSHVEILFNFIGRVQQMTSGGSLLQLRRDGPPLHLDSVGPEAEQVGLLTLLAFVEQDERLTVTLEYSRHLAHQDRIVRWIQQELVRCLEEMTSPSGPLGGPRRLTAADLPLLLRHPQGPVGGGGRAVSDPWASLQRIHTRLDELHVTPEDVESIYPCTSLQEGILLAQLRDKNGTKYRNRFVCRLTLSEAAAAGPGEGRRRERVDCGRLMEAWRAVCRGHPILRTILTSAICEEEEDRGAFMQVVLRRGDPSVTVSTVPPSSTALQYMSCQPMPPRDRTGPPHHLTLYRYRCDEDPSPPDSAVYAVLDIDHTLIDARSFQIMWALVASAYASIGQGLAPQVPRGRDFSDYVMWLRAHEDETRRYWRGYLRGVRPCILSSSARRGEAYPGAPSPEENDARGPIVPVQDARRVTLFCRDQGITVAMLAKAAWAIVLRLYMDSSSSGDHSDAQVCFGYLRSDAHVLDDDDDAGGGADEEKKEASDRVMLGPMISMLPCRFDLGHADTMTVSDVLQTSRLDTSSAMRFSGCSLAKLHDDLGLSASPLFDTGMSIQPMWSADLGDDEGRHGGARQPQERRQRLVVETVDAEDPNESSIAVSVQYSDDKLLLRLVYQRVRVPEALVERMAGSFVKTIEAMVASPPQQPLQLLLAGLASSTPSPPTVPSPSSSSSDAAATALSEPSRPTLHDMELLKKWNADPPMAVETCLPDAFRATAASQPSAPVVDSWDRQLSYGEMDELSDRLAYTLRVDHGVGPEDIVPFACEKAASAFVVLLAISKAGAAFLPLDIDHPPQRLAVILRDVNARLVLVNNLDLHTKMTACFDEASMVGAVCRVDLTTLEEQEQQKERMRRELAAIRISPRQLCYVIYTSGSTGRPKGIMLEHRGAATVATRFARFLGFTRQTRVLQLSRFVFDMAVFDMVASVFSGACVCMPSGAEATGDDVAGAARRLRANYVCCTPTHVSLLRPEDVPDMRTLVLGGEPLPREIVETWTSSSSPVRLFNCYGPAEVGTSSGTEVRADSSSSSSGSGRGGGGMQQNIGVPCGCRYWVVDPEDHDELRPIGTAGELVLEGPTVARGYINNPRATAAAFIDPPAWTRRGELRSLAELGQHRFYKTGDIVTQVDEATFLYAGRKDTQVKIRGQRIELAEMEYHLNRQISSASPWVVELVQRGGEEAVDSCLVAFFQRRWDDNNNNNNNNNNNDSNIDEHDAQSLLLGYASDVALMARDALRSLLPPYMVPEFYVPLRAIPKTWSMKTDRKALREMTSSLSQSDFMSYRVVQRQDDLDLTDDIDGDEESHSKSTTRAMRQAWAELLHVPAESIRPRDDFFALGGNSIRAMHLVAGLRRSGYQLAIVDVFGTPTLLGMAQKARPLLPPSPSAHPGHAGDDSSSIKNDEPSGTDAATTLIQDDSHPWKPSDIPCLESLAMTRTWLRKDNIESVAPTTEFQALFLSTERFSEDGSWAGCFSLQPRRAEDEQSGWHLDRLRDACHRVIANHGVLRTVFVQSDDDDHGTSLWQVTLKESPVQQVRVTLRDEEEAEEEVAVSPDMCSILPRFYLRTDSDGATCKRLTISIHHAHYDAFYMGQILRDLSDAYHAGGRIPLPEKHLSFHKWSAHVGGDHRLSRSHRFWAQLLEGSAPLPISSDGRGSSTSPPQSRQQRQPKPHQRGQQGLLGGRISSCLHRESVQVPLSHLQTTHGTPANVLKAVWSCVLAQVLGVDDVVFGVVSANRFSNPTSGDGEAEHVPGPCINIVPVRASVKYDGEEKGREKDGRTGQESMSSLVRELQQQANDSLVHQHIGFRSIIRDCTHWPPTSRFNSVINLQNHEAIDHAVTLGHVECTVAASGGYCEFTDIFIIAVPQPEAGQLAVEIAYSSDNVSAELSQRITTRFQRLLDQLPLR